MTNLHDDRHYLVDYLDLVPITTAEVCVLVSMIISIFELISFLGFGESAMNSLS